MVVGQAAEQRPSPLLVIVPRDQGARYISLVGEFAGVPGCQIIVDRRVAERRRPAAPCRPGERRTGHLEPSRDRVVLLR